MKGNVVFEVRDLSNSKILHAALVTEKLPPLAFSKQGTKLEGNKWYVINPDFLLLSGIVGRSIWIEQALADVAILPLNPIVTERFEVLDDEGNSLGLLADVLGE